MAAAGRVFRIALLKVRTGLSRRGRRSPESPEIDVPVEPPRPQETTSHDDPTAEQLQLTLIPIPKDASNTLRTEFAKTRFNAQVDAFSKHLVEEVANRKAYLDADLTSLAGFHTAMIETAKTSLERARQAAAAVQTAAGAIGIIYAAVLGVAFSVEKPLPPRGVLSGIFLGLAMVLAAAFVGWLPTTVEEASGVTWPHDTGELRADSQVRTSTYIRWMRRASLRRGKFLRAAVLALGFGVAFLPVAFISIGSDNAPSSADAELQQFPPPPTGANGADAELQKILYQAQVTEAGQVRQEQLQATPGESWRTLGFWVVYGIAAIGFLLIVLTITRLRLSSAPDVES